MIDMVFLLLVFFMTVSTLAQADRGLKLDLPESLESQVPDDLSDRGTISLDAAGDVYLGTRKVGMETMRAEIRSAIEANPELKIHLRAAEETPYKAIKRVLKACAKLGAYEVIYATYQTK